MANENTRLCFISTPEGNIDLRGGDGVELHASLSEQVREEFMRAQKKVVKDEGIPYYVPICDALYSK